MSSVTPLVSVVVVSFNTREMTLECLRTARAATAGLPTEFLVVDNASTDGSAEAVRREFPTVAVIANAENVGFGAANNQAMARAHGEFFLLLNTDAFPDPRAVGTLLDFLRTHPEVGVVGPRLRYADGTPQPSCHRFPTPGRAWLENLGLARCFANNPRLDDLTRWDHATERRVDFVIGACLLVRRRVFQAVGGFDERFFLYSEETDWQRRIRAADWQVAFTPAATVTHLAGGSGARDRARINRHFFESLDRYVRKHHGLGGLLSFRLAMTVGCLGRALLWSAASLLRPRLRPRALAKARLHWWLTFRQATARPASALTPASR